MFIKLVVLTACFLLAAPSWADDATDSEPARANYTLTVGSTGHGNVNCGDCNTVAGCNRIDFRAGTTVTCRAKPARHARFLHWTINGMWGGYGIKKISENGFTLIGNFSNVAPANLEKPESSTP